MQPQAVSLNEAVSNQQKILRMVDVGKIEQAVMNLVINAKVAMPSDGSVVIRIHNRVVS